MGVRSPADVVAQLRPRSLTGRVVILTGATAGIGRSTTERLAGAGATVVAVARSADALAELETEVPGVVAHRADVSDDGERIELVRRTLAEQGRIDAVVNGVGIGWSGPVEEMTVRQVRRLFETNVVAAVDLTLLVLPHLLARGDGDIVFVGSAASWFATPSLTVYSATKYAVEGFAEGLRREVATRGVRVHAVHPGLVSTQFAGRSAGDEPGDVDAEPAPGPGMSPQHVAAAIHRVLTRPGSHSIAVPRLLEVTRLVKVPPLQQIADAAVGLIGPQLARQGRAMAERRARRSTTEEDDDSA